MDTDKSYIEIKQVSLVNFVNNRTYTQFPSGNNTPNWGSLNTTAGNASYDITLPDHSSSGIGKMWVENYEPTEATNTIIVMPQGLIASSINSGAETSQALYIKYDIHTTYNQKTSDGWTTSEIVESNIEVWIPFYGTLTQNDNEFKMNQKIVYTVTISPFANDEIKFDPLQDVVRFIIVVCH